LKCQAYSALSFDVAQQVFGQCSVRLAKCVDVRREVFEGLGYAGEHSTGQPVDASSAGVHVEALAELFSFDFIFWDVSARGHLQVWERVVRGYGVVHLELRQELICLLHLVPFDDLLLEFIAYRIPRE